MGAGRKPIGKGGRASQRQVDEDALVTRYTKAGLPLATCARRFGISTQQAKAILAAHGVALRGRPSVDEEQVVAVYQRHHSVALVRVVFDITEARARAILHARSVEMATPPKPATPAGPGPARWVTQRQAARLLGTSTDAVRRAAANGQIRMHRDEQRQALVPASRHRNTPGPARLQPASVSSSEPLTATAGCTVPPIRQTADMPLHGRSGTRRLVRYSVPRRRSGHVGGT